MKKKITVLALILTAFLARPEAAHAKFGIGFMVGEPNGITMKFDNFPIIGIGYSFLGGNNNWLHATLDYWILNPPISGQFHWYLGLGASIKYPAATGVGAGVRVPVGIQFIPTDLLEFFLEGAPGVSILPAVGFDWQAALGVRFYFL